MSNTPNTPNEIPGLPEIQLIADERSQRVSAWERFTAKVASQIRSNQLYRQPKDEINTLLECGLSINPTDLFFNHALAVTEVTRDQDGFSLGWDVTFNCLAASAGDLAPFSPPDGRDYYATREQALIALVGWLADKLETNFEILMGNEANEIDVVCPSCELNFVVDCDGDVVESYPGDRESSSHTYYTDHE